MTTDKPEVVAYLHTHRKKSKIKRIEWTHWPSWDTFYIIDPLVRLSDYEALLNQQKVSQDVSLLVEALSDSIKGVEIPADIKNERNVEAFKAGARAAVMKMNATLDHYHRQRSDS